MSSQGRACIWRRSVFSDGDCQHVFPSRALTCQAMATGKTNSPRTCHTRIVSDPSQSPRVLRLDDPTACVLYGVRSTTTVATGISPCRTLLQPPTWDPAGQGLPGHHAQICPTDQNGTSVSCCCCFAVIPFHNPGLVIPCLVSVRCPFREHWVRRIDSDEIPGCKTPEFLPGRDPI